MMVLIDESEESKKIRGAILADITLIEKELSRFFSDYFGDTNDKKKQLFDIIFNTDLFTFNKKIELFKKIITKDFWLRREELIEALTWLKKTRNSLAHWEWDSIKSQGEVSILKNPQKTEFLKVDEILFKEHNKKFMKVLEFFDAYFA